MLILSRRDVFDLLTLADCIDAVERAFRLHAEGRTLGPGVLGVPAGDGGFHIKAAGLLGERSYFAAKTNANFPDNPRRFRLPTIQGTVVLADAGTGETLAVSARPRVRVARRQNCSLWRCLGAVMTRPTTTEMLKYFLYLGSLGFGGPVALVGYMQHDLVEQRKWFTREEYMKSLALSQLAPGPLAAQLA